MRQVLLTMSIAIISLPVLAQRTVELRTLWTKPQVHVLFGGYIVSFTIKDIDRALALLAETGDSTFGTSSGLDTARDYVVELYDVRTQYLNDLQPMLQNGVGVFLLNFGHAYIETPKHKRLQQIISDRLTIGDGINETYYLFYDPKTDQRLFSGKMRKGLYGRDLGIDY